MNVCVTVCPTNSDVSNYKPPRKLRIGVNRLVDVGPSKNGLDVCDPKPTPYPLITNTSKKNGKNNNSDKVSYQDVGPLCEKQGKHIFTEQLPKETTYQDHFSYPDPAKLEPKPRDPCSDSYGYGKLKRKPPLAVWELDARTLKHRYRKTPQELADIENHKKIPPWKSEYDDIYNRTAEAIIRTNKIRLFYRRQKALKLNL